MICLYFVEIFNTFFIALLVSDACTKKAVIDLGFIIDESGSIRSNYEDEKNFVIAIAQQYNITANGVNMGVIR